MITDDIRQSTILLTSLEKRRLRGDLIEVFKLVTGKEHIDMIDYTVIFFSWMTPDTTPVVTDTS